MIKKSVVCFVLVSVLLSSSLFADRAFGVSKAAVNLKEEAFQEIKKERENACIECRLRRKDFIERDRKRIAQEAKPRVNYKVSKAAIAEKRKVLQEKKAQLKKERIEKKERRNKLIEKDRERAIEKNKVKAEYVKKRAIRRKVVRDEKVKWVKKEKIARCNCACERRFCLRKSACEKKRARRAYYTGLGERKRVASKKRKLEKHKKLQEYRNKKKGIKNKRVAAKKGDAISVEYVSEKF